MLRRDGPPFLLGGGESYQLTTSSSWFCLLICVNARRIYTSKAGGFSSHPERPKKSWIGVDWRVSGPTNCTRHQPFIVYCPCRRRNKSSMKSWLEQTEPERYQSVARRAVLGGIKQIRSAQLPLFHILRLSVFSEVLAVPHPSYAPSKPQTKFVWITAGGQNHTNIGSKSDGAWLRGPFALWRRRHRPGCSGWTKWRLHVTCHKKSVSLMVSLEIRRNILLWKICVKNWIRYQPKIP